MKRGWYRIITPWGVEHVYGRRNADKVFSSLSSWHKPATMEDWRGWTVRVRLAV